MVRTILLGAALAMSAPAFACPMADAAAFAEAAEKVKTAEGTKITLAIDGMTCGSCSEKITSTLSGLSGVVASATDYQTGRTEVAYDPAKTSPEKLMAAIEELGFKAKVEKPV